MQTNTRKFQNDIRSAAGMTGKPLEKILQGAPKAMQSNNANPFEPIEPQKYKNPALERVNSSTRLFLNDLRQTTAAEMSKPVNKPLQERSFQEKPLQERTFQEKPVQIKAEELLYKQDNSSGSQEYNDLALEKAKENALLIKAQAEKEIEGILAHIRRIQAEYEIDRKEIDERIEKKQSILSRLKSLSASLEKDPSGIGQTSNQTEELYKSINSRAKTLSIITAVFDDLNSIGSNSDRY